MRRRPVLVLLACVLASCQSPAPVAAAVNGGAPAAAPAPQDPGPRLPSAADCTVDLDHTTGRLRINDVALADHRLSTMRAALGEPDRVQRVQSSERFEEYGAGPDDPPTSMMVEMNAAHYVYDELGLVLRTRKVEGPEAFEGTPRDVDLEILWIFFDHERRFTSREMPPVVPGRRGTCTLAIDGHVLDPSADVVPAGVTYQTDAFEVLGRSFGPTSVGARIDSIYAFDPRPAVQLYLDEASTRRPSYAEIRL